MRIKLLRRKKMKELYIRQEIFTLGEKLTVKDDQQKNIYYIEGSFFQIPKTFSIMDENRNEVALITKKILSFLPKFYVEVQGKQILTINKELSFFKARYTIDAEGIEVQGNWWDMDFQVYKQGQLVGQVKKEWFTWGDSYKVQILDEDVQTIVIAIVVAIDCVKSDEAVAASAAP